MKKAISTILIITIICISLTGCGEEPIFNASEGMLVNPNGGFITTETELEGYKVDNDTPLDRLLTREYGLDEISEFFGIKTYKETDFYDPYIYNSEEYTMDMVNERFPIECLRGGKRYYYMEYSDDECFYTVYKIKEGGYFYLVWLTYGEDNIVRPVEGYYIKELAPAEEIHNLKMYENTYEDVLKIAPDSTTFCETSSTYSITPLDNDMTVVTYYEYIDELKYRLGQMTEEEHNEYIFSDYERKKEDLVIKYMYYYSRCLGTGIANIMDKDVPK